MHDQIQIENHIHSDGGSGMPIRDTSIGKVSRRGTEQAGSWLHVRPSLDIAVDKTIGTS